MKKEEIRDLIVGLLKSQKSMAVVKLDGISFAGADIAISKKMAFLRLLG